MEYLIKQYALEPGALEIQYIEEYFGEFPRRKTAAEIMDRLRDRESLILMAEAPLPDDPSGALVPVSYKIVHEIRADESITKLRDLVTRLNGAVNFDGRRILYSSGGAVWVRDISALTATRIPEADATVAYPIWSADSRSVVTNRRRPPSRA